MLRLFILCVLCVLLTHTQRVIAESQGSDYKGVTDPFGDPANYEFAEDEKEDKEFFHLGRYLQLGIDIGAGVFTGGLGKTTTPGAQFGGRLIYFFDKCFGMEAGFHYSQHTDSIVTLDGTENATIDTTLMPITLGFRYYFDIKNAPRAIAVANPYLVLAGGLYMRNQNVTSQTTDFFKPTSSSTNSFGAAAGMGAEFNVYRKHIFLGGDFRYHFVFFPDEDATYAKDGQPARVNPGDRGGDFFSAALSITYNF